MEKKDFMKNIFSKENLYKIILSSIILIVFMFSFISFLAKNTKRRTFIFPSAENGVYVMEYRNLSKKASQGDIQLYIDELLLGSQVERTKYIFTPGTKVLSCFVRDKTLYLNLSEDLINVDRSVIDIKTGVQLLDKNIKKNFPKIENIQFFVDGKIAFEK